MLDYRKAEKEFRPLGFSTRTINALVGRDICSLRDLGGLTEHDLRCIAGIGSKAIEQLKIYVQKPAPTLEVHDRPRVLSAEFSPKALTEIDAWGYDNKSPSRAESIRRLVELGLKVKR